MNFDLVSAGVGVAVATLGFVLGRAARALPVVRRHSYRRRNPGWLNRQQQIVNEELLAGLREWREIMRDMRNPKGPGLEIDAEFIPPGFSRAVPANGADGSQAASPEGKEGAASPEGKEGKSQCSRLLNGVHLGVMRGEKCPECGELVL